MRILAVIAELGSGGAEQVVVDLATALHEAGDAVTVASGPGWRLPGLVASGVTTVPVPLERPGTVRMVRSAVVIARELRRGHVDVVHAHNVRATAAAHLARRLARVPVGLVTTVHGLAGADYPRAVRVLRRCSDLVVAVSPDVRARLVAAGLPGERIQVVEPVASLPAADDRDAVRRRLGLAPEDLVVLSASRLAPPKRPDLLLEAWSRLGAPGVLLVAGDGPLRRGLAPLARGLGDRVRLLGERHDVPDLLAAADLAVLSSDREGMPLSVLEALAAGVPVVASAVGGVLDLPEGLVTRVEPGSAQSLADGLARLVTDPQARRAAADAGRRWSRGRAAASSFVGMYRAAYEQVDGPGQQ